MPRPTAFAPSVGYLLSSTFRPTPSTSPLRRPSPVASFAPRVHLATRPSPIMTLSTLSTLKDIDSNAIDPASFAGKVVFAMNVASACGYTSSGYELLNHLTTKYSSDDLVAIAIPCNSFGWQENGTPDEIKTFALARANRLIITERSTVNGGSPNPIVALAKDAFPGRIMWNFDGRFLFNRSGTPVARFGNSSSTAEIEAEIDKLL